MRRSLAVVVLALVVALPALPSGAAPVATESTYDLCGRVFPDPHAYWPAPTALPAQSPWAKGNLTCRAIDFLGWQETLDGLALLDGMFGDFIEIYDLSDPSGDFADALDLDAGEGQSAGLPGTDLSREKLPMVMIRVTDEEDTATAIDDRAHFVYTLSIHGIERAGVEGGIRAIEDLATWASCEKHGDDSPAHCELEGQIPHPILETMPEQSVTAGEALKRSSVWFVLSNPDGWYRGDKQEGGFFYQRYNGNGVDLNRDWPTQGYTFRPYTPWSEPETRTVGKVLQAISDDWTGGVDLHGQLIDRAFSFTLIGGQMRSYDKDRETLQYVKGAWADAESRLAWNPLIKANDEPEPCVWGLGSVSDDPNCDPTNRIYGVQWGTIWDTIEYTVTGAVGDWIDSPIGLDALGIDNEMSMSHLSNCGVGTCFLTEFEQLHVDGNKSLIYGMIHYALQPADHTFGFDGEAGWLHHDRRIQRDAAPLPSAPADDLAPQEPIEDTLLHDGTATTYEFDVLGPDDGVYNGGIRVQLTGLNVQGVSATSLNEIAIDRQNTDEDDPDRGTMRDDGWTTVNTYFNQAPTYLQAGFQLDANVPAPGRYRVRVTGVEVPVPTAFDMRIEFLDQQAWPDPGQLAYDVSNLDFFTDLAPFTREDGQLSPLPVAAVATDPTALDGLDTVVVTDGVLPDDADERRTVAEALEAFVEAGGNLVLTDSGLEALALLGVVPDEAVEQTHVYAGHVQFSTDDGATATYDDPLAANVDQPGAAEGPGHRHQIAEPVPTGFAIQEATGGDADNHPQWSVERQAFEDAGGRTVGVVGSPDRVTLGEVPLGAGQIRILGSLLPVPTQEFDHPYGLAPYGVTYSGYEVLRNLLDVGDGTSGAPGGGRGGGGGAPSPAPSPATPADPDGTAADRPLPATGGAGLIVLLSLCGLVGALAGRHRR